MSDKLMLTLFTLAMYQRITRDLMSNSKRPLEYVQLASVHQLLTEAWRFGVSRLNCAVPLAH